MGKKKPKTPSSRIATNKRARFEYYIEETLEAGLALEGWEVKSLREGRIQFNEGYVIFKEGEAFLFGVNISPLLSASTHITPDPTRTRKLLLHKREIDRLTGLVERKGQTVVPLNLYWKKGKVKVEIGIARGKKAHDKRATEREKDWQRDKERLMKFSR